MLEELARENQGRALAPATFHLCVGVIRALLQIKVSVLKIGVSSPQSPGITNSDDGITPVSDPAHSTEGDETADTVLEPMDLSRLWPIYIPDNNGILVQSTLLTFNDANWIAPSLLEIQKKRGSGPNANGLRFVHTEVGLLGAKALGVKSLREQLFAGDRFVCPAPSQLKEVFQEDTPIEALGSLVGLADFLGARRITVTYDANKYPSESLMHPALEELQGEAVIVYIEGVTLGAEGVSQVR